MPVPAGTQKCLWVARSPHNTAVQPRFATRRGGTWWGWGWGWRWDLVGVGVSKRVGRSPCTGGRSLSLGLAPHPVGPLTRPPPLCACRVAFLRCGWLSINSAVRSRPSKSSTCPSAACVLSRSITLSRSLLCCCSLHPHSTWLMAITVYVYVCIKQSLKPQLNP